MRMGQIHGTGGREKQFWTYRKANHLLSVASRSYRVLSPWQHFCTCIAVPTPQTRSGIIPQWRAVPYRVEGFGCSNLATCHYTSAFFPNLQDRRPGATMAIRDFITAQTKSPLSCREPFRIIPCKLSVFGESWPARRQANPVGTNAGLPCNSFAFA